MATRSWFYGCLLWAGVGCAAEVSGPPSGDPEGLTLTDEAREAVASEGATAPPDCAFLDVSPDHPFHAEITWLCEAGISMGRPCDSGHCFDPAKGTSRMAFATFLHRAVGEPMRAPDYARIFNDVTPAYVASQAGSANAIGFMGVTGLARDANFGAGKVISRQAAAAFLYRFAALTGTVGAAPAVSFPDVPATHAFATEIRWAASRGLLKGYADGTFRPTDPITRQAMAAVFYRMHGAGLLRAMTTAELRANDVKAHDAARLALVIHDLRARSGSARLADSASLRADAQAWAAELTKTYLPAGKLPTSQATHPEFDIYEGGGRELIAGFGNYALWKIYDHARATGALLDDRVSTTSGSWPFARLGVGLSQAQVGTVRHVAYVVHMGL